jgi:hypothetical protein
MNGENISRVVPRDMRHPNHWSRNHPHLLVLLAALLNFAMLEPGKVKIFKYQTETTILKLLFGI